MGPVMERSSGSRMFPAPQMGLGGRNGQILGDKTDVRVNGRFGAPESPATRLKGAGNTAWGNAPGSDTAERVEPCKGEVMEVQSDGYGAPSGLDRFRTIFSRGVAPGFITSAFQAEIPGGCAGLYYPPPFGRRPPPLRREPESPLSNPPLSIRTRLAEFLRYANSIPHIPFIKGDFVAFQKLTELFLKGFLSMMLLLRFDVFNDLGHAGLAD